MDKTINRLKTKKVGDVMCTAKGYLALYFHLKSIPVAVMPRA
jgi:hypothetical protein